MPNAQATKKKPMNESTLTIRRMPDVLDELKDITGAVQQRAFELFEQRDGESGHDLADWLAAEAELVSAAPVTIEDHADRVEVRIALDGLPAQDLSLLLTNEELVLVGDARGGKGVKCKWLLVRVDLPPGVSPDEATAAVESGKLLAVLRRQEIGGGQR